MLKDFDIDTISNGTDYTIHYTLLNCPEEAVLKQARMTIHRNTGNQQKKRLDQYGGKSERLLPPELDNGKQV